MQSQSVWDIRSDCLGKTDTGADPPCPVSLSLDEWCCCSSRHLDRRARREREQPPRCGLTLIVGADGLRRPYREMGHHRELA